MGYNGIASGPDGNIWVNGLGFGSHRNATLTEVNPATGQVTEWILPSSEGTIPLDTSSAIIVGPDRKLWFPLLVQEIFPGGPCIEALGSFDPSTKTFIELDPTSGNIQTFTVVPVGTLQESPTGPTVSNGSISAQGSNILTTSGFDFRAVVASFTPQTPIPNTMEAYQATIDWGNGQTSDIILTVMQNGTYDVTAGHTYQTAGTYNIKVTIGNYNPANPLGDNAVTVFSTAYVNPFNMAM